MDATFRTELRELNEQNFQRFEAGLGTVATMLGSGRLLLGV
jgi:hypothetical protein